jgi:glycosyltransferase involved in cell wall biosynthesis
MEMVLVKQELVMQKLNIKVAVWMVTCNHEKYIEQSLLSVLSQRTNFETHIFLGIDKSNDRTIEICQQFKSKYPSKITISIQTQNNRFVNSVNIYSLCLKSKAKYIAMLEGDDYWIDEKKLQTQVDLLDNSWYRNYVLCATNYIEYYENTNSFSKKWAYFNGEKDEFRRIGEIFQIRKEYGWKTKTNTLLFRTNCLSIKRLKRYNYMADSILMYELSKKGPFLFCNHCTAVYRLHNGGIWSMKSINEKEIISKQIKDEIKRVNFLEEVILKKIKKRFGLFNNL